MAEKAKPLTPIQKRIIDANNMKFPSDIAKLSGMEGTTPRQISDYIRRAADANNPHNKLACELESYIQTYGLPSKYGKVVEYIGYLRAKT